MQGLLYSERASVTLYLSGPFALMTTNHMVQRGAFSCDSVIAQHLRLQRYLSEILSQLGPLLTAEMTSLTATTLYLHARTDFMCTEADLVH